MGLPLLEVGIVGKAGYDLEDRKALRWEQDDYSTNRSDARGAPTRVAEADWSERIDYLAGLRGTEAGRRGSSSLPREL